MRVIRTIQFDEEDLQTIHKMQLIAYKIDEYHLADELDMCSWIAFSGNLDKLEHRAKEQLYPEDVEES